MESRIIENAEEKLSIEPMVLDLFMEGKLKAKGNLTTGTPMELTVEESKVKAVGYLTSEPKNKFIFDVCDPQEYIQKKNIPGQYKQIRITVNTPTDGFMKQWKHDLFDWKFKIIEIVDENNTANIKVNDTIELSEKMKSRTAGGSLLSKEDKLIAAVEENVGLRITENIKID